MFESGLNSPKSTSVAKSQQEPLFDTSFTLPVISPIKSAQAIDKQLSFSFSITCRLWLRGLDWVSLFLDDSGDVERSDGRGVRKGALSGGQGRGAVWTGGEVRGGWERSARGDKSGMGS